MWGLKWPWRPTPPLHPARQGDRPKAIPAGLVASDTKTEFSQAVPHTSAGVALEFSPAPGRGGRGRGAWSSENRSQDLTGIKGSGRGGKSHTPQLQPSIHTSWLEGDPPERDGSFPSPPSGGNSQAHSQGALTLLSVDLPILGPSQAPQNQSPFKSRGPDPCPQFPGLPPPRAPHRGRTSRVSKQGTEHTAWRGQGGGGERPIFLLISFLPPSPPSPTSFLPSSHPSIHP